MASTLHALVIHTCHRRWEIKPTKGQGPAMSVKVLGIPWSGHIRTFLKYKESYWTVCSCCWEDSIVLRGLFGFGRQHIHCTWEYIYYIILYEWLKRWLSFSKVQGNKGFYSRYIPWPKQPFHWGHLSQQTLRCLLQRKMPFGAPGKPQEANHSISPGALEQGHGICSTELFSIWKADPVMLLGSGRN